jgi:hypothetical protein
MRKKYRAGSHSIVNDVKKLAIQFYEVRFEDGRTAEFLLATKGYGMQVLSKEEMTSRQLEAFKCRANQNGCYQTKFEDGLGYMVVFCRLYLKGDDGMMHPAYGAYVYSNCQPGHNVITKKKNWLPNGKFGTTTLSQPMRKMPWIMKDELTVRS